MKSSVLCYSVLIILFLVSFAIAGDSYFFYGCQDEYKFTNCGGLHDGHHEVLAQSPVFEPVKGNYVWHGGSPTVKGQIEPTWQLDDQDYTGYITDDMIISICGMTPVAREVDIACPYRFHSDQDKPISITAMMWYSHYSLGLQKVNPCDSGPGVYVGQYKYKYPDRVDCKRNGV